MQDYATTDHLRSEEPITVNEECFEISQDLNGEGSDLMFEDAIPPDLSDETNEAVFNKMDPSTWPSMMSLLERNSILQSTPSYCFFGETNKFNVMHFWRRYRYGVKPNGEWYKRDWIRVSTTTNSAFCLPCCVFTPPSGIRLPWNNFGNVGFRSFQNALRGVTRHEASITHLENMRTWKVYLKNQSDPKSVQDMMTGKLNENVSEWRQILYGILDAIFFLAKNNLIFQGGSKDINQPNCGNFLSLIKLLSKYSTPLQNHVKRLKNHRVSYLSTDIQNEFIDLIAKKVKQQILECIRMWKYFAIMFDCTPDTSHHEQMSQIIRFVECSEDGCVIRESFIDFISTTATSGADLTAEILKKLEADGLDLSNCRGQGYDNGSNMAGCYSGVQARIQEDNEYARFSACAAHGLNLVGTNAAEKCSEARLLLGTIQNLYVFFSGSTPRWEFLTANTTLTLKSQSSTRWSSRAAAVKALTTNYENVINALDEMIESDRFKPEVVAMAQSKLRDVQNFRFLLGLTIWNEILSQIDLCNVSLQKKNADISKAEKMLKVLCKWLEDFRKTGFQNCLEKVRKEADRLNISIDAGFENSKKGRGLNPKYDDPNVVEASKKLTPVERFRQDFFDKLVDSLIYEMNQRFSNIRDCVAEFSFLWGAGGNITSKTKQRKVKALCERYPKDLDRASFSNEIETLHYTIQQFEGEKKIKKQNLMPLDVLNCLYINGLESTYKNTEVALRIFLTIPVSVATNERSFSKLKLIKNYLRSSMGQERLSNLAIISIEHETAEALDHDEIINDFVSAKIRKVKCI